MFEILKSYLKKVYRKFTPILVRGDNNIVSKQSKIGNSFTITIIGEGNIVEIGERCSLTNTRIIIEGNNNHLIIEDTARFLGPCTVVMQGNSTVRFGKNCGIRGVEICAKDGSIDIGELVMTSYGIVIRNHDSHRVMDIEGNVTNSPRDIVIGKHVWVCQNSSILKGCNIGDDSIVAYGAVATKGCPPNSIIAGNPGKIVKQNIIWDY